jgi:hypothetical protein
LTKDPSTELGRALSAASSSSNVKAQMKFAQHLPLRLVDKLGRPLVSRIACEHEAIDGIFGLSADGGLGKKSIEFGSSVPYDTSITLGIIGIIS